MNTVFEQGHKAAAEFDADLHDGINPYRQGTYQFNEWEKGWQWYITQTIEWERDEAMDISDQEYHERQQYCNE